jgi:integrase
MAKQISPQQNNGGIRLRWSFKGKRYSLVPVPGGRFDNSLDMKRAQTVANLISADIAMGQFDQTLAKYGGSLHKTQLAIDDAQERLKQLRQQRSEADLKELWEKYRAFKAPQLAPTTLKIDYGRRMNFLNKLEDSRLSQAIAIRDWIVANTTTEQAKKILQNLNACCEWAVKSELIEVNPFAGMAGQIHVKHDEEDINPFNPLEKEAIIHGFYSSPHYGHYGRLVDFLFATGCRPSEAIPLEWSDLRGNKLTFQRTYSDGELSPRLKTQKKRTIILNERAIAAVGCSISTALIFPSPDGEYISWNYFATRAWVGVLAEFPEIEYRNPKQTRHTFITERILAADSPADVSRYVGNSPGTIYKNYLGASRSYSPGER